MFLPNRNPEDCDLVQIVLDAAKKHGATAAEVGLGRTQGFEVKVRCQEIDKLEYAQEAIINLTAYMGQRRSSVSSTDLNRDALALLVEKACYIASCTEEDECFGLADRNLLAYDYPDLDLNHPITIPLEEIITLAKNCEAIGLNYDNRITNSEGVTISSHNFQTVYANTNDFLGCCSSSVHGVDCSLLAMTDHKMQGDGDFTVARHFNELTDLTCLAKSAAQKTLQKLGAKTLTTRKCPIILQAEVAKSLLGNFLGAINGGNLYRNRSFLVNSLGKQIFPKFINLYEEPHLLRGLGSSPFDNEGVITSKKSFVEQGVVANYILNCYTARKLKMQTTGNAGGVHNLFITPGNYNFDQLLKLMDTGLLVTELLGQGVNLVNGDYSRGAFGFWVEHGVIQYPVEEITIAGNLAEMFLNIVAVGNDVDRRGNINTGSILIENINVAGGA